MRYLLILITALAFAADKPPAISAEHRAKFWKTQANLAKVEEGSNRLFGG